jgi:glucose dehydrogenase
MRSFVAAPAAAEQDLAVLGMFHCVREQIADHLFEQARVATNAQPAWNQVPDEAMRLSMPSPSSPARPSEAAAADWPSHNKTLTSERYSQLSQINTTNVGNLKVLCTYDTGQYTSFETGPIMVNNALIGTTEHDIFSLDPTNCHENWRTHEDYKPASLLAVNRGAAYMDGLLFRGTEDGRVLAYDFKTGKRVWDTTVADPKLGESTPAAPIAWEGLVFIGNAGGDNKGVKGRMYALDAKTGKIVWEFYLVPKTAGDEKRIGNTHHRRRNVDLLHAGPYWSQSRPRGAYFTAPAVRPAT